MSEAFHSELRCETRSSGYLERPIDAAVRSADMTDMSVGVHQGIRRAVGHVARSGFDDFPYDTHDVPRWPVRSLRTLTSVRFASSILKSLCPKPRALASSASAARR